MASVGGLLVIVAVVLHEVSFVALPDEVHEYMRLEFSLSAQGLYIL